MHADANGSLILTFPVAVLSSDLFLAVTPSTDYIQGSFSDVTESENIPASESLRHLIDYFLSQLGLPVLEMLRIFIGSNDSANTDSQEKWTTC